MKCAVLAFVFFSISFLSISKTELKIDSITLNPNKYAPLSAVVYAHSSIKGTISICVKGKNGPISNVGHHFEIQGTRHTVEVLRLYPDYNNTVDVFLHNRLEKIVDSSTIRIQTEPIYQSLLDITIETAQLDNTKSRFILVNNIANIRPSIPFVIDVFGDIRWLLYFEEQNNGGVEFPRHHRLHKLNYCIGLTKFQNGNFWFGDKRGEHSYLYEVDLMGRLTDSCSLRGYEYHHDLVEKPNGNLLVPVSDINSSHLNGPITEEDFIIEIDRKTKEVIEVWDLKQVLDEYRDVTDMELLDQRPLDWLHIYALVYDDRDSSIIISARFQGVIKPTYTNEVKWILSHHNHWGKSRKGKDLNQYLLTQFNSEGQKITDKAVLLGQKNYPNFEWNQMQHAPILLPNGNLMLFDNGYNRYYDHENKHSRVVEFKIDEENMSVQQIWSYGERQEYFFSKRASNVHFFENANHLLINSAYTVSNSVKDKKNWGKSLS